MATKGAGKMRLVRLRLMRLGRRVVAGSYCCRPRFANLLILPTYHCNSNDMQSTVISLTCQSQIELLMVNWS